VKSVRVMAVIGALLPIVAWTKADVSRIEIRSGARVHTIASADLARRLSIWNGPGTSSDRTGPQTLADWSAGGVEPPAGLTAARVTVFCSRESGKAAPCHVVDYAYDARSRRGYIYLPASGEDGYQLNVRHVLRGVEGRWFRSTREWDELLASRR
jgi:hypothetical protein